MNAFLKSVNESRTTISPEGEIIPINSEVSRAEGALIERSIHALKPKRSIEIGCRFGISTHYICGALRDAGGTEHVIIDSGQRLGTKNLGLYNVLKEGYGDLVSLYNEQSQLALPWFVERGKCFDFALIDGAHTFDHTLIDFFFIDKILSKGGLILFDDADWPGIRKVCKFITTNRRYEAVDWVGIEKHSDFFESRSSMVAMRKIDDDLLPRDQKWDHFVDF